MSIPVLSLWIGGKEIAGSGRLGDVFDPATGQIARRVPFATKAEVGQAVAAAEQALPGWSDTPPLRRARILARFRELLEANRDELARLVSAEHGKTLPDAVEQAIKGLGGKLDMFYYAFGETDLYVIVDLPDNASMAAVALMVAASGVINLNTTVLMTPEELDNAAKKTPISPDEASPYRRFGFHSGRVS